MYSVYMDELSRELGYNTSMNGVCTLGELRMKAQCWLLEKQVVKVGREILKGLEKIKVKLRCGYR